MNSEIPIWAWHTLGAFVATVGHLFIDVQIGLYGPSSAHITLMQAINIGLLACIFGVWAYSIASAVAGSKSALATVVVFSLLWAAVANGAAAFVVAPPPSLGFPYQDIAHGLSFIFGLMATVYAIRRLKELDGVIKYSLPFIATLLVLGNFVTQTYLAILS